MISRLAEVGDRHDVRVVPGPAEPAEHGVDDVVLGLVPIEHRADDDADVGLAEADGTDGRSLEEVIDHLSSLIVERRTMGACNRVETELFATDAGDPDVADLTVYMVDANSIARVLYGLNAQTVL